ncbi:MAG: hypothetical protein HUU57_12725 [Bdellovibrio sp.]|nr:hypothetical protein [Bdellovibrio sp.]
MKSWLVLAATLVLTSAVPSWGAVWNTTRSWTTADDVAFAQFIENDFHEDIFSNPSSAFYGLKTDCADAVYAARIIFSARHGLPVKFTDPTKSGAYLTERMSRWDALPETERLLRFIDYIADLGSTYTLELDSYPVDISLEAFRPGVIFLSPHLNEAEQRATGFRGGHAEYVKSVTDTGFVEVISSTSPRLVRTLSVSKNPYMAPLLARGGYRALKKPQDFGQRNSELPFYSLKQFEIGGWAPLKIITRKQIFQWHEEIRRTLRTRVPSFDERVEIVTDSICSLLKTRAILVYQGWSLVSKNDRRCLTGDLQDEFSTDSRDRRIRDAYLQVHDLYDWKKRTSPQEPIAGNVSDAQDKLAACSIQHWPGRSISAWEVYRRVMANMLVSSADYAPAVRWGERPADRKDCR